ncbi:hypothetical protein VC83_06969 [Pseudogymnoascus destructans]|uniref:SCP domain-containing protein n=2 Tax=Pseudogymnoascus destructans TaxID=655981 RepID=L8FR35_PSED2|nr:uncharacterized protein VC83_06969 [Pseudogymnoascus destructans]ELR02131.1 hypothetical protein GMDG_05290 [Pseudogymnoascus destructans 20631-21]OAF56931.1 hypothetical protein VC83_06969 [Pseudogymnoascus destructans]
MNMRAWSLLTLISSLHAFVLHFQHYTHSMRLRLTVSLLLPSAYATVTVTVHTTIHTTLGAAATPAAPSTEYTSPRAFRRAILDTHNFYRKDHNASALAWNGTSAAYAAEWAEACEFEHSGGPSGENLAAGYPNATSSIDAWGTERSEYDFKKAEFSHETGHFTQVVWKDTTSVGCGRRECDGKGGSPGWYVVCEYYPPGNVIGAFEENVQEQVEGVKNGNSEGVVSWASGRVGRGGWEGVLVGLVGWMML